jgi:hypothetical protein
MNHMTTLGQVGKQVEAMSKKCFDEHVSVKDIEFDSLDKINIAGKPFTTKSLVQRSICTRLGVPHHYLRKCPTDLQAENLNHWITQIKNEQLFARFDGDSVRALFSTRFVHVDNVEVMKQLDAFGFSPETKVQ